MEFIKNSQTNVSWTELFNKLGIKHEDRLPARNALRKGIAKFDQKELMILQTGSFFANWYAKNKEAMKNSCSTETIQYFESILIKK